MKKVFAFVFGATLCAVLDLGEVRAADLTGMWTNKDNWKVHITKCQNESTSWCAKVVSTMQKDREYEGTEIVGLKPQGASRWSGGAVYDVHKSKLAYAGNIMLQASGGLLVQLCAYGIFCKSHELRRLN